MKSSRKRVVGLIVFLVGLYATWRVATWLAWRMAGLDRDEVVGGECDDCEVTVLLDQVGYVLACFATYFFMVWIAWEVWHRTRPRDTVSASR